MTALKWLGALAGVLLLLLVLLFEVAWAEKQFRDYRTSIVRETVEALKNDRR